MSTALLDNWTVSTALNVLSTKYLCEQQDILACSTFLESIVLFDKIYVSEDMMYSWKEMNMLPDNVLNIISPANLSQCIEKKSYIESKLSRELLNNINRNDQLDYILLKRLVKYYIFSLENNIPYYPHYLRVEPLMSLIDTLNYEKNENSMKILLQQVFEIVEKEKTMRVEKIKPFIEQYIYPIYIPCIFSKIIMEATSCKDILYIGMQLREEKEVKRFRSEIDKVIMMLQNENFNEAYNFLKDIDEYIKLLGKNNDLKIGVNLLGIPSITLDPVLDFLKKVKMSRRFSFIKNIHNSFVNMYITKDHINRLFNVSVKPSITYHSTAQICYHNKKE